MFGLMVVLVVVYVSIYLLSNCLGWVVWGVVFDCLGRFNILMIIYIVIVLFLLVFVMF